jgi:hypothetical protein
VSKVTEKIKIRSKPTLSENFNSHPLLKYTLLTVKKVRKDIGEKQKLVNTKIADCYVHNVITKFEFIEFVSCKFLPH